MGTNICDIQFLSSLPFLDKLSFGFGPFFRLLWALRKSANLRENSYLPCNVFLRIVYLNQVAVANSNAIMWNGKCRANQMFLNLAFKYFYVVDLEQKTAVLPFDERKLMALLLLLVGGHLHELELFSVSRWHLILEINASSRL